MGTRKISPMYGYSSMLPNSALKLLRIHLLMSHWVPPKSGLLQVSFQVALSSPKSEIFYVIQLFFFQPVSIYGSPFVFPKTTKPHPVGCGFCNNPSTSHGMWFVGPSPTWKGATQQQPLTGCSM